jgi:uncharacterized protein
MGLTDTLQNRKRFREIVRGKVKKNLQHYITKERLVRTKHGNIRIPRIDIPRFKFQPQQIGGVAQGDGKIGDKLGPHSGPFGPGGTGDQGGDHLIGTDLTTDDLIDLLEEEIGLANLEDKELGDINHEKKKYTRIRKVGSSLVYKRAHKFAMQRGIMSGDYDHKDPIVIVERPDKRFRDSEKVIIPQKKAVLFYILDISGSMGDEQRRLCLQTNRWVERLIARQYDSITTEYIVHDVTAEVVDENKFYRAKSENGTAISPAYKLVHDVIKDKYPINEWNIYPFHYTDGDNWGDDNLPAISALEKILRVSNIFCYAQCLSNFIFDANQTTFLDILNDYYDLDNDIMISSWPIRTSRLEIEQDILPTIKTFLNKDGVPFYDLTA